MVIQYWKSLPLCLLLKHREGAPINFSEECLFPSAISRWTFNLRHIKRINPNFQNLDESRLLTQRKSWESKGGRNITKKDWMILL